MKSLKCRDAGLDCDYVITGNTTDEVLRKAGEHGKRQHNMNEVSGEMRDRLMSLIRDE